MPKRKDHVIAGTLAGGMGAFCLASIEPDGSPVAETVGGVLGGYFGGRLPDLLEPSRGNPRHRNHCHSWAALGTDVGMATKWLGKIQSDLRARALRHKAECAEANSVWEQAWHWVLHLLLMLACGATAGLAAGVASHLVLDARTKAGLQAI